MHHGLAVRCGIAALAAAMVGCVAPYRTHESPVHAMSWIEGRWVAEAWGGELIASYAAGTGGMVIGYTTLIRGGERAYHEFEVFRMTETNGSLVPHPGGLPSERFELVDSGPGFVVFEHREKDFPTRIRYERVADALLVTLSDPHGPSDRQEVFRFVRSAS